MHAVFSRQLRHRALGLHSLKRRARLKPASWFLHFRIPDLFVIGDQQTSGRSFRHCSTSGSSSPAIAEGLRTAGLKGKLETLEARLAEIDAALAAPAPSPVRLHPNLSEMYRRKVAALAETLSDPEIRMPALETIRGLIAAVTVHVTPEGIKLDLEGALSAMVGLAEGRTAKSPLESGLNGSSVLVVAGTGFEPVTFRL